LEHSKEIHRKEGNAMKATGPFVLGIMILCASLFSLIFAVDFAAAAAQAGDKVKQESIVGTIQPAGSGVVENTPAYRIASQDSADKGDKGKEKPKKEKKKKKEPKPKPPPPPVEPPPDDPNDPCYGCWDY
jgi:hypothetical protein